ncbi:hypothetical protein [Actinomycetospora termitidis]|uniref:Uncharacterized protein n=1 Tax=Actinomycetospora termitidis TaxID=3053470 RepID=A0ABT7MJH0_9PSEU|nr:hypothetical protein [Actinomycetospora sp. Odt1-22]MDL5159508.1 hypothetical protein [Actinomycetospora sp. Odt1-22]
MIIPPPTTGSDRRPAQVLGPDDRRGDMTVSIDQLAVPSSRQPASGPFPAVTSGVPGAVAALRRAIADGTVHHHGTAPAVGVVRVWAAGGDLDAQRDACTDCAG